MKRTRRLPLRDIRYHRVVEPSLWHLIRAEVQPGRKLFESAADMEVYRARLLEAAREWQVRVALICLRPGEILLLLQPAGKDSLAGLFQAHHTAWARHVHRVSGMAGRVFRRRFASTVVENLADDRVRQSLEELFAATAREELFLTAVVGHPPGEAKTCAELLQTLATQPAGPTHASQFQPASTPTQHKAVETRPEPSQANEAEQAHPPDQAEKSKEKPTLRNLLSGSLPKGTLHWIRLLEAAYGRRLRWRRVGRPAGEDGGNDSAKAQRHSGA